MLRLWRNYYFSLALKEDDKKEAMLFIGILMEEPQQYHTTKEEFYHDLIIREILREIELTIEEYNQYLEKL